MKIKPIWLEGHGYVSQREEYLVKRDTGFEPKTVARRSGQSTKRVIPYALLVGQW